MGHPTGQYNCRARNSVATSRLELSQSSGLHRQTERRPYTPSDQEIVCHLVRPAQMDWDPLSRRHDFQRLSTPVMSVAPARKVSVLLPSFVCVPCSKLPFVRRLACARGASERSANGCQGPNATIQLHGTTMGSGPTTPVPKPSTAVLMTTALIAGVVAMRIRARGAQLR